MSAIGRRCAAGLALLALAAGASFAQEAPSPAPGGEDADASAGALVGRGALQTELGELEAAQESYLAGIELLIEAHGEFSPELLGPYSGLARAYLLNDQPLEAITVLEQARHISQRNFGLLNLEQTELLDDMSRAYVLAGDTAEAQAVQRERLTVALRRFGEDDPRVIPFHNRLAEYYDLSRMRVLAREHYEAVVEILRENFGEDDGRVLEPLSELVRIDILLGSAGSARRRLLQVLDSSDNATPTQIAGARAALGDWELSLRRPDAAFEHYREAYATLRAEDPANAARYFAAPRFVNFVPPPSPVDRRGNRDSYAWGSIVARFRVSADGHATDIAVVDADPPGLMDARYVARLAEATYRPRLVNGEPADTASVSFSHQFRYFAED